MPEKKWPAALGGCGPSRSAQEGEAEGGSARRSIKQTKCVALWFRGPQKISARNCKDCWRVAKGLPLRGQGAWSDFVQGWLVTRFFSDA